MGKIEDKFHFIFECQKYNILREELFRNCLHETEHFHDMTRAQKVFYMFNSSNEFLLLKALGGLVLRQEVYSHWWHVNVLDYCI